MKDKLNQVREALKFYNDPPKYSVSTPFIKGKPFYAWDNVKAGKALTALDEYTTLLEQQDIADCRFCVKATPYTHTAFCVINTIVAT